MGVGTKAKTIQGPDTNRAGMADSIERGFCVCMCVGFMTTMHISDGDWSTELFQLVGRSPGEMVLPVQQWGRCRAQREWEDEGHRAEAYSPLWWGEGWMNGVCTQTG